MHSMVAAGSGNDRAMAKAVSPVLTADAKSPVVKDFCVSNLSTCSRWAISCGLRFDIAMDDADLLSGDDLVTTAVEAFPPVRAALQGPLCAFQCVFWHEGLQ